MISANIIAYIHIVKIGIYNIISVPIAYNLLPIACALTHQPPPHGMEDNEPE